MEESVGVSYADKFISFEGALTDRDIKTLVSESWCQRAGAILSFRRIICHSTQLLCRSSIEDILLNLEMQPYGSIVRMTVISRLLSV